MSRRLLTIFGATGNQGGSVVATVLAHQDLASKYSLRAITRDPSKPNAQALASKGVELAKADLNDLSSVKAAVKGSYGVFAVTNYWETTLKDVEFAQGKNLIDACLAEGVQHLVWSSLPHATKLTNGALTKIEHFESKAEVAEYAEKVKGDKLLASYFMPAYFMSNLTGQINPGPDGVPTLSQPWKPTESQLPMIDIRADTGKYVMGLFEAGSNANGLEVQGVSEWVVPKDITDTLSKITGKEVKFHETEMSVEMTSKMDRIPAELSENMLLIRDFDYYGRGTQKKQAASDKFIVGGKQALNTWEQFARQYNKWQF